LLGLMCFNAARLESRLDQDGRLVPLDQQDRSLWDRALIRQGYQCLVRSSQLDESAASRFHLEAAIAARHCSASSFAETDWVSICHLYDRLLEQTSSPMVVLNRAVAVSYRDGPDAGSPLGEAVYRSGELPQRQVVAAVLANLYERAGLPQKIEPGGDGIVF